MKRKGLSTNLTKTQQHQSSNGMEGVEQTSQTHEQSQREALSAAGGEQMQQAFANLAIRPANDSR